MRETRRLFRLSNLGVLVYAVLNGLVLYRIWAMILPAVADTAMGVLSFVAFYLLCACISMSIVGEWVCRLLMGARRITRRDWLARLTPMERQIREGIAREYQYDLDELQIFYVYDPLPSAFAVGHRTICVSTALMDCTDDVVRAALAQQTGRILNYDSMLSLYVTVGNVFVLGLLLIVRAVQAVVSLLGLLLTRGFFGRLVAILASGLTWIPVLLVTALLNISYLIINLSDQRKTYEADMVAVRLGYGQALIRAIEEMDVEDMAGQRNLWGILNRPHPGSHDRIGRIQDAMIRHHDARRDNGVRNQRGGDAHTQSMLDWLGVQEPSTAGETQPEQVQPRPRLRMMPIGGASVQQEQVGRSEQESRTPRRERRMRPL